MFCVAGDAIINGITMDDHDRHLDSFLARCQDKNIKIKQGKSHFKIRQHHIHGPPKGHQTDPQKKRERERKGRKCFI